ncbi:MAG TPA: lipoyl synthase [Sulfurimonas sp.]|nr:lipoyl synthase [Sulfurimonas sp.]
MNPYKPRVKAPDPYLIKQTKDILQRNNLNSVCEEASCPNRAECYFHNTTTFMILGKSCTRSCHFCSVQTGKGEEINKDEPSSLARAINELGLDYVVLTSVDRDDLKDYGAGHFKACVSKIKEKCPKVEIELLTPDFRADSSALDIIISLGVKKLAHNEETIRRISKAVRPQSSYDRSLKTLEYYALHSQSIIKSSLMLGLGESDSELLETMQDLLDVGVSELTLGQYLQPSPKHLEVQRYCSQDLFDELKAEALDMGFKAVASGPLVRSSYHAKDLSL